MGVKSTLGQIGNLCNFADFVERIQILLPKNAYKFEDQKNLTDRTILINEVMASCHAITYVG